MSFEAFLTTKCFESKSKHTLPKKYSHLSFFTSENNSSQLCLIKSLYTYKNDAYFKRKIVSSFLKNWSEHSATCTVTGFSCFYLTFVEKINTSLHHFPFKNVISTKLRKTANKVFS